MSRMDTITVRCDQPGCARHYEQPAAASRYPVDVREEGFRHDPNDGRDYCREHAPEYLG